MAPNISLTFTVYILYFPLVVVSVCHAATCTENKPILGIPIFPTDIDILQFALNLEHIEAEFFLFGALGYGLDGVEPDLAMGGPPPIGAMRARLDRQTRRIIAEFGYQEVGHLRALKTTVGGFPRPLINLSSEVFANIFDNAVGYHLSPPFDPYLNPVNYLLASYVIPYVGLVGYVGANPTINGYISKRLLAGLLAVESGQDAVIRTLLYERSTDIVKPYMNLTVGEFTDRISELRNKLAGCGIKDEGLVVPLILGAETKTTDNILSADANSLAYKRTPSELLRIVYGSGDESKPGGFLPLGGDGAIARSLMQKL